MEKIYENPGRSGSRKRMRFQRLSGLNEVLPRTGCVAVVIALFSYSLVAQVGISQRQVRPREIPGAMIPAPSQPKGPSSMKLRVEEGFVTAEIRNTPLQKVLEEFAARTGQLDGLGGPSF